MKLAKAGFEYHIPVNPGLVIYSIEKAGRKCYKSQMSENTEEGAKFIKEVLIAHKHESVLEHASISLDITCDTGISHELVRHRLASFSQESTRYCNYSKDKFGHEITVIRPVWFNKITNERADEIVRHAKAGFKDTLKTPMDDLEREFVAWYLSCENSELEYFEMLENGASPQQARDVLPKSLKTEIVMTANIREWRHILKLRAAGEAGKPHPQMLEVMVPVLKDFQQKLPALFEDIVPMDIPDGGYTWDPPLDDEDLITEED